MASSNINDDSWEKMRKLLVRYNEIFETEVYDEYLPGVTGKRWAGTSTNITNIGEISLSFGYDGITERSLTEKIMYTHAFIANSLENEQSEAFRKKISETGVGYSQKNEIFENYPYSDAEKRAIIEYLIEHLDIYDDDYDTEAPPFWWFQKRFTDTQWAYFNAFAKDGDDYKSLHLEEFESFFKHFIDIKTNKLASYLKTIGKSFGIYTESYDTQDELDGEIIIFVYNTKEGIFRLERENKPLVLTLHQALILKAIYENPGKLSLWNLDTIVRRDLDNNPNYEATEHNMKSTRAMLSKVNRKFADLFHGDKLTDSAENSDKKNRSNSGSSNHKYRLAVKIEMQIN